MPHRLLEISYVPRCETNRTKACCKLHRHKAAGHSNRHSLKHKKTQHNVTSELAKRRWRAEQMSSLPSLRHFRLSDVISRGNMQTRLIGMLTYKGWFMSRQTAKEKHQTSQKKNNSMSLFSWISYNSLITADSSGFY
jgi:hypothetical protein